MGMLSKIGLGELAARRPRERATFFFLIAVSTFLFMDQNLMAPNLSAIWEDLAYSKKDTQARLEKEDADYRQLGELVTRDEARARAAAQKVAALRSDLLARTPSLAADPERLDSLLAEAAAAAVTQEDLAAMTAVSNAVRTRAEKEKSIFQKEMDDQLAGRASMWFWLLGGVVAVAVGYVTDKLNRKKLLFATILVGALPCLFTGFAQTVGQFVALRALTGIGIGAVLPLTYSILGDLFSARGRPGAAAWVGLATGIGIAGGQLLAGIIGPEYGWRLPFILVALPNLVIAFLFLAFAAEPKRGSAEDSLHAAIEQGATYEEKIRLGDLKKLFVNRTNLLVFAQGIPGSMPWGFFFTFLVDFYHADKGFSVQDATLLVTVFGAGAILGGFVGGLIGGKLYHKNPKLLPTLNAATILGGIIPILLLVNWSDAPASPLQLALEDLAGVTGAGPSILGPVLIGVFGAFLATMASANVKAVLIDVNLPENRGTIFSLFNLADDLGKGLAPFLIGGVLAVFFGRVISYNISILMWLICGAVWLALIKIFPQDVAALEKVMAERAKTLHPAGGGSAGGGSVPVAASRSA